MIKLGFIGLGDMGEAMCLNLIKKSNTIVYIYDADPGKLGYVASIGGVPCEISSEVAERADIIFMMCEKAIDVKGIVYSMMGHLNEEKIIIDFSTIEPWISKDIAKMVKETGADFADAPVVNFIDAAKQGELGMFFGGSYQAFKRAEEYLKMMAVDVIRMGENTEGLAMKICHNMILVQIQNSVNEALIMAEKAGLYINDVVKALDCSYAQNTFITKYGKSISQGNFDKNYSVKEMNKDIEMVVDYAEELQINLRGLDLIKQVYGSALTRKLDSNDYTSIYNVVKNEETK